MTDTKLCEIEYLAIELSALDEMDAKAVVIEADRIRKGNIAEPVPLKMRICATCRYWQPRRRHGLCQNPSSKNYGCFLSPHFACDEFERQHSGGGR